MRLKRPTSRYSASWAIRARRSSSRHETKTEPPNDFTVDLETGTRKKLTDFRDPAPQLTGLKKELIKYKRDDGVPLSGTLYLPPDYKEGTRLPLIIWAYPLEYSDAATAGQVRTSPYTFTRLTGPSQLFFVTQGYAVLDEATMPVVGDPETMNDTYVEQISAAARAAIEVLDKKGVIDPKRVGVGGHSYGAFMTANLLGPYRPVRRGHRPQRCLQPLVDSVRFSDRAPQLLGGDRPLHQDVAVYLCSQDQRTDPADPRRGRQQLRHVPDPVRAAVPGDQGQRRHGPAGALAAREPRLSRPRIGPARAGRDVRLGRPVRQEPLRRREFVRRSKSARHRRTDIRPLANHRTDTPDSESG